MPPSATTRATPARRKLVDARQHVLRRAVTKVATVGVNTQTDSQLNAELFGEVDWLCQRDIRSTVSSTTHGGPLLERAARPAPAATTAAPVGAVR
jgi:hypothetical protein